MNAATSALMCPRCGSELALEALQPQGGPCGACEAHVEAAVFPALYRVEESSIWEPVMSGEAGCFFHTDRIAVFSCARCGRFLCPLCRIFWAGENVCTACLEAASKAKQARLLASSRFHYDSLALAIATLPVLTWIFSMLTAPVALGFALSTWQRECSIVPRTKFRFVSAILLSMLTIAAWIVFWLYLVRHNWRAHSGRIG